MTEATICEIRLKVLKNVRYGNTNLFSRHEFLSRSNLITIGEN